MFDRYQVCRREGRDGGTRHGYQPPGDNLKHFWSATSLRRPEDGCINNAYTSVNARQQDSNSAIQISDAENDLLFLREVR